MADCRNHLGVGRCYVQDRYAGDIGDYGKIGLLRALQAQGLSVGINWYRVNTLEAGNLFNGNAALLWNISLILPGCSLVGV